MIKELKQRLQQQYNEMYKTDWKEIVGGFFVGVGLVVLTYLWFSIIN
jgi:hypothetical protein